MRKQCQNTRVDFSLKHESRVSDTPPSQMSFVFTTVVYSLFLLSVLTVWVYCQCLPFVFIVCVVCVYSVSLLSVYGQR